MISLLGADIIAIGMLWQSVMRPTRMIQRGMELLSEQETNNRLAEVGQPDADNVARIFNTLISRLHAERIRLQEQDQLLGSLIDVSPMGVAMMDFDGKISRVNPAFLRITGITDPAAPLGHRPEELNLELVNAVAALNDGDSRTLRLNDASLYRGYRLSFMDTGFRRHFLLIESLTDEVLRAEREAYGRVIRLMAHEVNNSMSGFTTLLHILSDIHSADSELMDVITSVSDRCAGLGKFIAGYADVVRLPEPRLAEVQLTDFLQSSLPFWESCAPQPVRLIVAPDLPSVMADISMLGQVMVNILKNAAESIAQLHAAATPATAAEISINAACNQAGDVELVVTDNGAGISPRHAARIFESFFSTKSGGQGIGLTLVAEILRRHNCRFSLSTDSDGLTRFRIVFPSLRQASKLNRQPQ